MKTIMVALLAIGCLGAAEKKPKQQKAAASGPMVIPPDALQTPDGSFSYTDKDGKKWLYRRTPFGVSKVEDKPVVADATEDKLTTAVEKGDTIQFERPGPFGATKWEKKKTELNEDEKKAWDRERQKSGGNK